MRSLLPSIPAESKSCNCDGLELPGHTPVFAQTPMHAYLVDLGEDSVRSISLLVVSVDDHDCIDWGGNSASLAP